MGEAFSEWVFLIEILGYIKIRKICMKFGQKIQKVKEHYHLMSRQQYWCSITKKRWLSVQSLPPGIKLYFY